MFDNKSRTKFHFQFTFFEFSKKLKYASYKELQLGMDNLFIHSLDVYPINITKIQKHTKWAFLLCSNLFRYVKFAKAPYC